MQGSSREQRLMIEFSSDLDSSKIRLYDGRGDGVPVHTLVSLHRASVHLMTVSWDLERRLGTDSLEIVQRFV